MANWAARVEWNDADDLTDVALERIAETLRAHSAAVGREREPDRASVNLTVEANTLRQADDLALRLVRDAVRAAGRRFEPSGVEVLDEATFAARLAEPTIPPLVGYAEIAELAGVSRQRARELGNLEGFPPAVVETQAGPLRVRSQVEIWMSQWERKPGRPRKASS
ncbi:hypothetical protein [Actinopolymorpha pittospori]